MSYQNLTGRLYSNGQIGSVATEPIWRGVDGRFYKHPTPAKLGEDACDSYVVQAIIYPEKLMGWGNQNGQNYYVPAFSMLVHEDEAKRVGLI